MLSMLQQMLLDDKDDDVREAVVRSLGLLAAFISDPDKYSQVGLNMQSLVRYKTVHSLGLLVAFISDPNKSLTGRFEHAVTGQI